MTRITEWKKEALPEGLTHIMGDKEEKVQGGRNRRKERRGEERRGKQLQEGKREQGR